MNKQIDSVLDFIHLPFQTDLNGHLGNRAFYQQTVLHLIEQRIKTIEGLCDIGNRIVLLADKAFDFRRADVLETAGHLLNTLPLPTVFNQAGNYFLGASCLFSGDIDKSSSLLEETVDKAHIFYKSKAFIFLGLLSARKGEFHDAHKCFVAAGQISSREMGNKHMCNPLTVLQSSRNAAINRSIQGDHRRALDILLSIEKPVLYLSRYYPLEYYQYQNSLAVELYETGQLEAAEYCSKIALASPYLPYYKEWSETGVEIIEKLAQQPSRSTISGVDFNYDNVTDLADKRAARPSQPQLPEGGASVSSLVEHKENREEMKKNQQKEKESEETPENYSIMKKRSDIYRIVSDPDTPESHIDQALKLLEQLREKQTDQK